MGCSSSKPATTGIVLPEQELALNNAELLHPFSNTPVKDLLRAFSNFGLDGSFQEPLFHAACRVLELHTHKWSAICEAYLASLRLASGEIDLHSLLLTIVLLGTGDYPTKVRLATRVYASAELSKLQVRTLLQDLVRAATQVLPQLCKHEEFALQHYLGRLAAVQTAVIERLLATLVPGASIEAEALVERFSKRPDLQKLWWAGGIRLLLIEEDIEQAVLSKEDQSCPTTTPRTSNPDILDESSSLCTCRY